MLDPNPQLRQREDRSGIVLLGRVSHHGPGLNHEIMEEFQKLGYRMFSQSTLPLDESEPARFENALLSKDQDSYELATAGD